MERLKSWEMKKKKEKKKVQDGRTQVLANEAHSKESGPLRGGEQINRRFGYGGNGDI
jgi:hypothetical protein